MASISTISEWLDENAHRAFPLKSGQNFEADTGYKLDQRVILDALCRLQRSQITPQLLGVDGVFYGNNKFTSASQTFTASNLFSVLVTGLNEYVITEVFDDHTVYLDAVVDASTSNVFTVEKRESPKLCNLEYITVSGNYVEIGLTDQQLALANKTAVDYPYYFRISSGTLLVLGEELKNIPDGTHNFTDVFFDPAVTYELEGELLGVSSVAGHKEKTTAMSSVLPALPLTTEVITRKDGEVELVSGYQFTVGVRGNNLTFSLGRTEGSHISCEDEFLDDAEKDCDEIISFINGVPPDTEGFFRLNQGNNIYIFNEKITNFYDALDPAVPANDHTIFIGLNFQESDICDPVTIFPS